MGKLIAFDVDHTLAIQNGPYPPGPVQFSDLRILKSSGYIVGIAGNWPVFVTHVPGWQNYVSFMGPFDVGGNYFLAKVAFLKKLKSFIKADSYLMVGNDPRYFKVPVSDDVNVALAAGYRFIREQDFADGKR